MALKDGRLCCSSSSSRWSARFTAACNMCRSGPACPCPRPDHHRPGGAYLVLLPETVDGLLLLRQSRLHPAVRCGGPLQPQPRSQLGLRPRGLSPADPDLGSWPWATVCVRTLRWFLEGGGREGAVPSKTGEKSPHDVSLSCWTCRRAPSASRRTELVLVPTVALSAVALC